MVLTITVLVVLPRARRRIAPASAEGVPDEASKPSGETGEGDDGRSLDWRSKLDARMTLRKLELRLAMSASTLRGEGGGVENDATDFIDAERESDSSDR